MHIDAAFSEFCERIKDPTAEKPQSLINAREEFRKSVFVRGDFFKSQFDQVISKIDNLTLKFDQPHDRLYLRTDNIKVCIDTNTNYDIGQLIITLTKSGIIEIINNKFLLKGKQRCDIPQMINNTIVFGHLDPLIQELILNQDYAGVIDIINQFVRSGQINGKNAPNLNLWPLVGESTSDHAKRINPLGWTLKTRKPWLPESFWR